MDRVENRRLARAVVAEQEQMPAIGNLDRRRPEVVELHQPNGGYPIALSLFHRHFLILSFSPAVRPTPNITMHKSAVHQRVKSVFDFVWHLLPTMI